MAASANPTRRAARRPVTTARRRFAVKAEFGDSIVVPIPFSQVPFLVALINLSWGGFCDLRRPATGDKVSFPRESPES